MRLNMNVTPIKVCRAADDDDDKSASILVTKLVTNKSNW